MYLLRANTYSNGSTRFLRFDSFNAAVVLLVHGRNVGAPGVVLVQIDLVAEDKFLPLLA